MAQEKPSEETNINESTSHYYLNESERQHLRDNFEVMFGGNHSHTNSKHGDNDKKIYTYAPSRKAFQQLLCQKYNIFLADALHDYVVSKRIGSYDLFETLIIDCARISPSRSLEMMWELAHFVSQTHKYLGDKSLLQRYCHLLFMLSIGTQTIDEVLALAESARITDFFIACNLKKHGVESADLDFATLFAITNTYLPHSVKAFQTYFCTLLLCSYESPSYKPYQPVVLTGDSEVATALSLAILGLHIDEMQGNWRRLYSSASDGLCFNRVVHHILGYDVHPASTIQSCQCRSCRCVPRAPRAFSSDVPIKSILA